MLIFREKKAKHYSLSCYSGTCISDDVDVRAYFLGIVQKLAIFSSVFWKKFYNRRIIHVSAGYVGLPFLYTLTCIFHLCVAFVLGMNRGPASGSGYSNGQRVLLNPAAERGWGRVPKLSQCALTGTFSGKTSASEK